jgi:hypothetical protein
VDELNKRLKSLVKTHPFFSRIMAEHKVPVNEIDKVKFDIKDLDSKEHAEANAHHIVFNSDLFKDDDFFENKIFFFVHEFYHWLNRIKEHQFYFNDPEEVGGFVLAIAWEIAGGNDKDIIAQKIFPIIKGHFRTTEDAGQLFQKMYEKAVNLIKSSGI